LSTPITTRADFQQLAETRLEEAKALLDIGKWDGAYYLAGYAVEIALKACIIKLLMATDAFPERRFSERCYTHKVEELLGVAGLLPAWTAATAANSAFADSWELVRDWSEQKRYHRMTEVEARELYDAITDPNHGVLSWIKTHW
jgi:HEPN domain-containing protein